MCVGDAVPMVGDALEFNPVGACEMDITFKDGQVIVTLPKAVLVMTKAHFIEALKRGKAFRRREALLKRLRDHKATRLGGL
jgi:hypothetical protein